LKVPKAVRKTIVGGEKFERDPRSGALLITKEWMAQTRGPKKNVAWFPWEKKTRMDKGKGKAKEVEPVVDAADASHPTQNEPPTPGCLFSDPADDHMEVDVADTEEHADKEVMGAEAISVLDRVEASICGPVSVEDWAALQSDTEVDTQAEYVDFAAEMEARMEQDAEATEAGPNTAAVDVDMAYGEEKVAAGDENITAITAMEIDNDDTAAEHAATADENQHSASSPNRPRRKISRYAYKSDSDHEDEESVIDPDPVSPSAAGSEGEASIPRAEVEVEELGQGPSDGIKEDDDNTMNVDNAQQPLDAAYDDDDDEVMLLKIPSSPPREVAPNQAETAAAAAQPAESVPSNAQSGAVASNDSSHSSSRGAKYRNFGLRFAMPRRN
jgi:hypothetical protein